MPARAPASMLMLQMVMRPSMDSARMAEPAYSMTQPVAPSVPICPMMARMMSLAVTPQGSWPSTEMRNVFGFDCGSVWVARTCSTSLVPMPKASAPKAPWVLVCESPQTIVMPGLVMPSSGPMTWTMPCSRLVNVVEINAEVSAVLAQRGDLRGCNLIDDVQASGQWLWAHCDRPSRCSDRGGAPCGLPGEGPRMPAAK